MATTSVSELYALEAHTRPKPSFWWGACSLLVLVAAAFEPALDNDFVDFDDRINFVDNCNYRGIASRNTRWAWHTVQLGVYQPLSWMILGLEYSLWGLNPRGYHLASVMLHIVNSILVYVLMIRFLEIMSGGDGVDYAHLYLSSTLAAILFSIHPLRAEVVAWASCQPYLPCTLFYLLSILLYLRASGRAGKWRLANLVASFAFFTAALLSKAVAVSLPLVLVFLDIYPLRRLPVRSSGRCLLITPTVWLEKLPFIALSVAFMVIALRARSSNDALVSLRQCSISTRFVFSCYCIMIYIYKTLIPINLMVYYAPLDQPTYDHDSVLPFVLSLVVLLVICGTISVLALRRRRPGLSITWAVYLTVLAPTLGVVRASDQFVADRYTYIASIGWAAFAAHQLYRFLQWVRLRRACVQNLTIVGLALLIIGLVTLTRLQCRTWRDAESLWSNVLIGSPHPIPIVYSHLGLALSDKGRLLEALDAHEQACELQERIVERHPNRPGYRSAWAGFLNNRGMVLTDLNRHNEALGVLLHAIQLQEQAIRQSPRTRLYKRYLAIHYLSLSKLQRKTHMESEAEESLRRARLIQRILAVDNPTGRG